MCTAGPRGHRSEQGRAAGALLHVSNGKTDGSSKRETEMGGWQACQGDHQETGLCSGLLKIEKKFYIIVISPYRLR